MNKFILCALFISFFLSPWLFTQDSKEDAEFYANSGIGYLENGDYDLAVENLSRAILLDPYNADYLYIRGFVYYYKGDYDLAIEDYSRIILFYPNEAFVYNDRGNAYNDKGDYDRAIEDYTHAILLDPNYVYAYYNRGVLYSNKGDYDRAIKDLTRAILLDPDDADAYTNRGNAYYYKGDYDLAIKDYSHIILLYPDDADAYNNRGNAYYYKDEYDLAIRDYSRAILLDPNDADAYYTRGNAWYYGKGDYDRAIEDLSRAILLDPNNKNAYYNRGNAYSDKGEYDLAIEDFTHAILLDPYYVDAYNDRGFVYSGKGEYDRAIEDFTRAILLDPNYEAAYINQGLAYNHKGEYDRAIENYTQAILLDPNDALAYNNRGNVYSDKGELDLAIKDYNQAILLDPDYMDAYNNRGNVYFDIGEYDLAIEDFTHAILLNPGFTMAHNNRGNAYVAKNEYDLAIEDYTQAIMLDPNLGTAYSNRGLVYSYKAEYEKAIEDYTRAILLDTNFALAYYNRGFAYDEIGEYENAFADYEKVLEAAENAANLNEIFTFTLDYANIIYIDNPYLSIEEKPIWESLVALTMDGIARSVRRAEQIRSSLGARGSAIMTQALYFYYMGLDLEATFGSTEKAFEYSESLRSRGFLDHVGTEAALRLPGINDEERERLRRLLEEIENRQNVLDVFRERPPQTSEEERSFVSAGQTLSVLEAELAALDSSLGSRIPQYAELRNPVPASLAQARDWLDGETAVLIYALWDDSIDFKPYVGSYTTSFERPTVNSYCLVLTRDGLTAVTLDHTFNYIQAIDRLRTNIKRIVRVNNLETDRNALYNALIKPALPFVPAHIKNLIIVPDGTLAHLPFDILREDYDSPELGVTYRLSLSPSVSVSMLSGKSAPQNLPILAFGGAWYSPEKTAAERGAERSAAYGDEPNQISWRDLPGTEAEVRMLEQLVPSAADIRVFRGSDVSEAQVKRLSTEGELARYPMLHFATHGYFKEEDLERAGIVLSEVSGLLDNGEDGYLTIPEIAVLDLNARMVLLSACETGLGVLRRGDGMVGMVRAFMLAGAEYLGVSLWEVNDDATMEFMTRLYGKVLNEGITFREAYFLVKDEFRNHSRWSHPNYWSAFVLYE